ncbi:hypothetical protein K470DRAFT_250860 [Piedraia hortae CBS 480.64]|uniref:BTB domain-containing protein n=1 Tax=Piedraia hortae CBS 480.64 TaxID=1314780 RepID=A0A6A7BVE3_9PEZI|nr:hypothetical protein K470DRAFT_250860 [Piedraia hortae CBS 480.64]
MSSHLWKACLENDVDSFRRILAGTIKLSQLGKGDYAGTAVEVSGRGKSKTRRSNSIQFQSADSSLKVDVNWRDQSGCTLLHHLASQSTSESVSLAIALIEHPLIDLYVQDEENGWTALHRAFYFGNINLARLMLNRDAEDALERLSGQSQSLLKVKDRDGLGPLDLYAVTIKNHSLDTPPVRLKRCPHESIRAPSVTSNDNSEDCKLNLSKTSEGDQVFTFGSNRNVSLGFGDEDNRQFPERVQLRRPAHLITTFYQEHVDRCQREWATDSQHGTKAAIPSSEWLEDLPFVPRTRPFIIRDVQMSKYSSAVLTDDESSNLYMCGHGKGGRLGMGDEQTRFNFACVDGGALSGKCIATVALGHNHTIATSREGDTFSWGSNDHGQLGFTLPADDKPISVLPRQIFGALKREIVVGVAASRIHSAAFSSNSLYTFGKNEGQLGIMDSDARSLVMQSTPRKVGASLFASSIQLVLAIDKATVCLLDNHDVWVFANYGYAKVQFSSEGPSNVFRRSVPMPSGTPRNVTKLTGAGDTVCALSSQGELFTFSVGERRDVQSNASTTNPSKIRSAITTPQCVWSPRKMNMVARDVGIDIDGSFILSTNEGSVWRRIRRQKVQDGTLIGTSDLKQKDYKFSRVPGLSRICAVRTSSHGAYAAIRRDCDSFKTQLTVDPPSLCRDLSILEPLIDFAKLETSQLFDEDVGSSRVLQRLTQCLVTSDQVEEELREVIAHRLTSSSAKYDAYFGTDIVDLTIPIHRCICTARSRVLRSILSDLEHGDTATISDIATCMADKDGKTAIQFIGLDILTIASLTMYLYTENVIDFWSFARVIPQASQRFRQIRIELIRVASKLGLAQLEIAVRQMKIPKSCMRVDLEVAITDPVFFTDSDVTVQLEDKEVRAHSAILQARCPFFHGLFVGRSQGRWLAGRQDDHDTCVDLLHVHSKVFGPVLRHIYADTGPELFDDFVCHGIDDFLDFVMDVMSVANELMLERLSQICQQVVGRYVHVRNVCELLNAISPSAIPRFKDAALHYLCYNLDAILYGHYLDQLDPDLLTELDRAVQKVQLGHLPFARSGEADRLLFERHPGLLERCELERRQNVDKWSSQQAGPSLGKVGSPRTPKNSRLDSLNQSVLSLEERPKDGHSSANVPQFLPAEEPPKDTPKPKDGKAHASQSSPRPGSESGAPWGTTLFSMPATDIKALLAQNPAKKPPVAPQKGASPGVNPVGTANSPKLSQKERKRLQIAQKAGQVAADSAMTEGAGAQGHNKAAWRTVSGSRTASQDSSHTSSPKPPQLTMRQTVANGKQRAQISQQGTIDLQSKQPEACTPSIHHPVPSELAWGPSMTEILAQEQAAKDERRAAVAKRDLADIQAEQEFQEWWDKESMKIQEEEKRAKLAAERLSKSPRARRGGHSNKGGGRGRKDKPSGSKSGA